MRCCVVVALGQRALYMESGSSGNSVATTITNNQNQVKEKRPLGLPCLVLPQVVSRLGKLSLRKIGERCRRFVLVVCILRWRKAGNRHT